MIKSVASLHHSIAKTFRVVNIPKTLLDENCRTCKIVGAYQKDIVVMCSAQKQTNDSRKQHVDKTFVSLKSLKLTETKISAT